MESVLGRYRNLVILVGVLFLQVLGLAVQVKRGTDAESDTRLIRIWTVSAITPLERGLVWMQNGAANLWSNYFYLRGVRAENRLMKRRFRKLIAISLGRFFSWYSAKPSKLKFRERRVPITR